MTQYVGCRRQQKKEGGPMGRPLLLPTVGLRPTVYVYESARRAAFCLILFANQDGFRGDRVLAMLALFAEDKAVLGFE